MSFSILGLGLLKVLLKELESSRDTRVAGNTGCVSPLQDLGLDRGWDEQSIRGSTPGVRLDLLGFQDPCLDVPAYSSHHQGRRNNGGWTRGGFENCLESASGLMFLELGL